VAAICSDERETAGGGADEPGSGSVIGAEVEIGSASEVPAAVPGAERSSADIIGAEVTLGSVGDGGGSDMTATRSLIPNW
jgi:hypothetical protein